MQDDTPHKDPSVQAFKDTKIGGFFKGDPFCPSIFKRVASSVLQECEYKDVCAK